MTACPATVHGTWRAYEHGGCMCPSDTRERVAAYRLRTRAYDARRAAERRAAARPHAAARQIAPRVAGDAERALRERIDLACRHVDPDLFYPTGTGGSADAQIKVARQVCAACPFEAQQLCLRAAIERDDDFAILSGTTPKQRREMRRRGHEVAA